MAIKLTIQGNMSDSPTPWKSWSQEFGVKVNLPGKMNHGIKSLEAKANDSE